IRPLGPEAGGIETSCDEMRERHPGVHAKHLDVERAETHGMLETFDRFVGRALPDPQESPQEPSRSEIGIQQQRSIKEIDPHVEIAGEVSESMTTACECYRVALPQVD